MAFLSLAEFGYAVLLLGIVSGPLFGGIPSFQGRANIGSVKFPGSVEYDTSNGMIRLSGSGENMWGNRDAFHFMWNKSEGDLSCLAKVAWVGEGRNPHRKAGWMIRAGLEADDAYVDAVVHGSGLISIQFRKSKGGTTEEIQSPLTGSLVLKLERTGDQFSLFVIGNDGASHPAGTITVALGDPVYVGLAVCSHDSTVRETAVFSNLGCAGPGTVPGDKRIVESTLETIDIETGVRTIVRQAREHFEAPNWRRDGSAFLYNAGGRIFTLPASGGTPETLNTGFASRCNNDHGLSWDGKKLVISHNANDGKSLIYVLPAAGGEPRLVTRNGPSYWHGWSPDQETLAYCAERNGEFDVYTIPVEGGEERRLTASPGLDDGPEYTPDGKYIFFNSIRTGQMKIWRMNPDGSGQVQFSPNDEYGDWFAHPSPDNKWIVFLSYDKRVEGHPPFKDVVLRLMSTGGGDVRTIARLFGGQGTINVHSWSPESTRFAFVSYRRVAP